MRKPILLTILLFCISVIHGYENSLLNMINPGELDKKQGQISIIHRFLGDITENPLDNLFGMEAGANVAFTFRYQLFDPLEMNLSYSKVKKEKMLGLAYSYKSETYPLLSQINLEYIRFEEPLLTDKYRDGLLIIGSLQNEPFWDRLILTANTGYDAYYERPVLAAGLSYQIVDKVYFISEWYPLPDKNTTRKNLKKYLGDESSLSFGLKMDTYGHHFKFQISNSNQSNVHRLSLGASKSNPWMFGFNLERRLGI